jgi:hypothetical protein
MSQHADEVDGRVAHGSQSTSDLARVKPIFTVGDIAHVEHAVLNDPVTSECIGNVVCRGIFGGQAADPDVFLDLPPDTSARADHVDLALASTAPAGFPLDTPRVPSGAPHSPCRFPYIIHTVRTLKALVFAGWC